MESVSVKDLKAHLSEYLRRASEGERIAITRRGREIAEIGPMAEVRRAVRDLESRGRARWSGGKPKGLRGIEARGEPVAATVSEDRR